MKKNTWWSIWEARDYSISMRYKTEGKKERYKGFAWNTKGSRLDKFKEGKTNVRSSNKLVHK